MESLLKIKKPKNFIIGGEKLNPKDKRKLKNREIYNDIRMTLKQWIKEKNEINKMKEEKK